MPKVLVIDDERNLQKLVKVNLLARKYQVLTAPDGERGLEVAQREYPDLVLLDLMMPGISGWDVLMTLKTMPQLEDIPVIIMTASVREGGKEKAYDLGASEYLTKPFGIDRLLHQVEQVLRKRG